MRTSLFAALVFLAMSMNAYGGDNGVYVGGALSRSMIDTEADFFGFQFDDDDEGYKVIVGFRPIDAFAIEANYVNFGSVVFDNRGTVSDGVRVEYEAQAIDAFAVGYLGGPGIEFFAKLGAVYWDADAALQGGIAGVDLRDSDSGADLVYGGGLQVHFGSLAARFEYESFDVSGVDSLELWSLGLTWTFL